MKPVRLEPAALRSQVKHSTTEPLRSLFSRAGQLIKSGGRSFHSLAVLGKNECLCASIIDVLFMTSSGGAMNRGNTDFLQKLPHPLLPFMRVLRSSCSYFTFIYCHFHFLLSFGTLHI